MSGLAHNARDHLTFYVVLLVCRHIPFLAWYKRYIGVARCHSESFEYDRIDKLLRVIWDPPAAACHSCFPLTMTSDSPNTCLCCEQSTALKGQYTGSSWDRDPSCPGIVCSRRQKQESECLNGVQVINGPTPKEGSKECRHSEIASSTRIKQHWASIIVPKILHSKSACVALGIKHITVKRYKEARICLLNISTQTRHGIEIVEVTDCLSQDP